MQRYKATLLNATEIENHYNMITWIQTQHRVKYKRYTILYNVHLILDYYRNLRNWIALEVKYSKEEKYNVEYLDN